MSNRMIKLLVIISEMSYKAAYIAKKAVTLSTHKLCISCVRGSYIRVTIVVM